MKSDVQGLGDAVKRRRGELRLSQRDLAAAAGLSFSTIQDIEGAKRARIMGDTLVGLDQGLQWTPGSAAVTLAGGEPNPLPDNSVIVETPTGSVVTSSLLRELMTSSRDEIRALADEVSADTGDPVDGVEFERSVLRLQRRLARKTDVRPSASDTQHPSDTV